MKVLILGKNGNLGNELMGVYSDLSPTGWDREEIDVTDEQVVWDMISELKPDLVYNCTAYNAVDQAEQDRITADSVNGYAVGNIAKVCKSIGATLVHFSSGMVFDGNNPEGYNEDDLPNPVNAYGRSKLLGEMEGQENADNIYIIRTSWLFGKLGPGAANKKSFSDLMIEKAKNKEQLQVVDDEIGKPTYTLDLAQAARAIVEETKPFGIYHITNSGSCSRYDWAKEIFKIKNMEVEIEPVKGITLARLAKRPHYEVINNTKFLELRPWTEALTEFLQ
ncbi:MAG TPA: dTDP-4-dehydrorhamnose reductase [Candidatus Binatia bacterium]|nr:dTDP-4-dehydrorhamnose reductase [Candidatus Binatia bacterium]